MHHVHSLLTHQDRHLHCSTGGAPHGWAVSQDTEHEDLIVKLDSFGFGQWFKPRGTAKMAQQTGGHRGGTGYSRPGQIVGYPCCVTHL